MKVLCAFIFIVAVSCKDILDCIQKPSGDKKLRIGGPDACEVKPHSKPWIVNLRPNATCGGTLIAKNVVLTARHCKVFEGDSVTIGDHDEDDFDNGEKSIKIKNRINADIEECGDNCDLAILVLEESVQTNENVQIAHLPSAEEPCPPGKDLVVCGWGDDAFNESRRTDKLWCVAQKCVDDSECPLNPFPQEYTLCISDPENENNSACGGDSGGPLTHTDENGKTTLYGVVSRQGDHPNCKSTGLFMRVSNPNVLNWINKHIQENAE